MGRSKSRGRASPTALPGPAHLCPWEDLVTVALLHLCLHSHKCPLPPLALQVTGCGAEPWGSEGPGSREEPQRSKAGECPSWSRGFWKGHWPSVSCSPSVRCGRLAVLTWGLVDAGLSQHCRWGLLSGTRAFLGLRLSQQTVLDQGRGDISLCTSFTTLCGAWYLIEFLPH